MALTDFLGQDVAGYAQGPMQDGSAGVPYSGINYGDVLKTLGLGGGSKVPGYQNKRDQQDASDINDIMSILSIFTGGLGGVGGGVGGSTAGGLGSAAGIGGMLTTLGRM